MKHRILYLFISVVVVGCSLDTLLNEAIPLEQLQSPLISTTQYSGLNLLPIQVEDNFKWGINGHPLTQEAYGGAIGVTQQLELLEEHQLSWYRVDVNTDVSGNLTGASTFSNLLAEADTRGIKILPVIILTGLDYSVSASQAYATGKGQGLGFATSYGSHLDYYELGNEQDNAIQLDDANGNDTNGDQTSHFDAVKFNIVSAYLKGMIDGIRQVDGSAKTIINSGGWLHYGFFQLLENAGVDYDIIGYHWYSDMGSLLTVRATEGDIIDVLSTRFSRPIWLTEINRKSGSFGNHVAEQAGDINNYINELDGKSAVEAFFVYELLDEPAFYDSVGYENPQESQYGIISWKTRYSELKYKQASETIKFKIEEQKYGYEDYVRSLYTYVNERTPDAGGLTYWTSVFKTNRDKVGVINNFWYGEGYGKFVDHQYLFFHSRPSDTSGRDFWIGKLRNGTASRESLINEFCISDEFWINSGSNNSGFIDLMFMKLLARAAEPVEKSQYLNRLLSGTTKATIVSEIIHSDEYYSKFIAEQYLAFLGRSVDGSGLAYFLNKMQNNAIQHQIINELLIGEEYWNNAIVDGYETRTQYPISY